MYILLQEAYNANRPGLRKPLMTRLHANSPAELESLLTTYIRGHIDERIDEAPIPQEVEPPGLVVEWSGLLDSNGEDIREMFPTYPWKGGARV